MIQGFYAQTREVVRKPLDSKACVDLSGHLSGSENDLLLMQKKKLSQFELITPIYRCLKITRNRGNVELEEDFEMATSQPKGIESLAKEVHSFERALFGLVAGSFVISGVSSFVNVSAAPRSQIAITTLIGTLAGCCAVVVTYLDWPNLPDEQDSSLMLFDSRMKSLKVKFAFFLSAVFFICYVEVPATSEWIALACDALAIYCLFSALVTGALASREIDRQEALWNKLDDAGRQLWSQRRAEEKSQQVELVKFVYRLGKLIGSGEYRQVGDLIRPLFRS